MLTKKDFGRLEKAFRSIRHTECLTFGDDGFGVLLRLNLSYKTGVEGFQGVDTFFFDKEDLESYEVFAQALKEKAEQYDPIDALFKIVDRRKFRDGEAMAKEWLRYDLTFVDTIKTLLPRLAYTAHVVAECYGNEKS